MWMMKEFKEWKDNYMKKGKKYKTQGINMLQAQNIMSKEFT